MEVGARPAVGGSVGGVSGEQNVVASSGGVFREAAVSVLRRLFLHGADEERDQAFHSPAAAAAI